VNNKVFLAGSGLARSTSGAVISKTGEQKLKTTIVKFRRKSLGRHLTSSAAASAKLPTDAIFIPAEIDEIETWKKTL
jgi:hypothetical protein